jgi:hypothetical protein
LHLQPDHAVLDGQREDPGVEEKKQESDGQQKRHDSLRGKGVYQHVDGPKQINHENAEGGNVESGNESCVVLEILGLGHSWTSGSIVELDDVDSNRR